MAFPGLRSRTDMIVGKRFLDPFYVIKMACRYYGLDENDVLGRRRYRELTLCRFMIMAILKKHSGMSLKKIGQLFDRDHTTVINAIQTLNDLFFSQSNLKREMAEIEDLIL